MATRRSKRLQEKMGDIPKKSGDDAARRRNHNNKQSPLRSLLRSSVGKISRARRQPRSVTFQSPVVQTKKDDDDLAEDLTTKLHLGQEDDPVADSTEQSGTMTIEANLVVSDDKSVEVSTTQYGDMEVKDTPVMPPACGEPDEGPSNCQEDTTATSSPHRRKSTRKSLSKLSRSDLKAGQRPRYLGDIKGKDVLEYLQGLLPSIFNLFKMMTPKAYDEKGQRTHPWPRFQAYLVLVDQVQCRPDGCNPSKRDRDRIIVTGFGFDKDHSKDLFMNAMQNAVFFDWISNEKAEFIFSTGIDETMNAVLN